MEYIFPLKQHIGAASKAVKQIGDSVKRGEKIAVKPEGALGANIFTSVSGTVIAVEEDKIVIEESLAEDTGYVELTGTSPLELIEEAGIVGLGGAGFPTSVKLQTKLSQNGAVIINAAECEPILSHNIARIEKEPEKLLRSLSIILDIVLVRRGIIALKESHKEAIAKLEAADTEHRYEIKKLKDLYPMGEERALIRETMGVLLPVDALPAAADVIVLNAETAYRIREAVEEKKPLIDKDMTVAGKLKENALIQVLFDVPIGRKVEDVLTMAGGIGKNYGELIMGGPFTGKRTFQTAPVLKTTGGIIAAEEFMKAPKKLGILVCACGAGKERLEEMAAAMGSEISGVAYCKQAKNTGSAWKCENPGRCPGQVEKILQLKKAGAEAVLISNCTDCTNTVMSCAPQLGLTVYHCTDGSLRAVNSKLIRKMHL